MLMAIITKDGILLDSGTPSMFVDDKTFDDFLKNPRKAIAFRNTYGENLCIGRLGSQDSVGVYAEQEVVDKTDTLDDREKGGVYYGYV